MAPPRKKARVNGSEKTPYRRYSPNGSSEKGGSEAVLLNVDKEWIQVEEELKPLSEKKFEADYEGAQEKEKEISDEERYQKLMDLLGKSKFYSEHLQSKLKEDSSKKLKEEMMKNRKKTILKSMTTNGKNQRSSTKEEEVVRKPKIFQGYEVPDEQPLLVKGGVLRNYQIKGFQWMCSLWENGINGILADEMGLGKTLQTISLFAHLVEMGVEGPFLVVAPLSTLLNWVSEIQRFTPDLPVLLFHGNKKKRAQLSRKVREAFTIREAGLTARPIVVTSYEIILNSGGSFRNAGWKYIVVDEGHRLKNNNCRLVRELRLYVTANKLLLTGTPLQNNLAELWSLLNFLMPEIFNDLSMFQSWFSVEQLEQGNSSSCTKSPQMGDRELQILTTLHEILSPFLLRRIKSDIDYKIPPKKEILVYCPMTEHQKTMYKATLEKTIKELLEKDVSKNKKEEEESLVLNYNRREEAPERYTTDDSNTYNEPSDLNYSMRNRTMDLRKVTNHPYLVEYPLTEDGMYYRSDQDMIDLCGKLKVLDQLLGELIVKRSHKTLIFSQMTRMLDILGDYLKLKGHKYACLDGRMNFTERQQNIKDFSASPDIKIFLLSTRAGGLGINLTAADTVIIYDSDWNPQSDLQAQDRCHRIGQTKPVNVYRLVTSNTIDERIVQRATSKRRLEKMVIHEKKFKCDEDSREMNCLSLTPKDLKELLEHSDHSRVVDRKDGAIFTPKELAALMDRGSSTDSKYNSFKTLKLSQNDTQLKTVEAKEN